MTLPERDISRAHKSTVSSKKTRTANVTAQRSRSLLAERRIPGHMSTTTRMGLEQLTVLKGEPSKTRDNQARQHRDRRQG